MAPIQAGSGDERPCQINLLNYGAGFRLYSRYARTWELMRISFVEVQWVVLTVVQTRNHQRLLKHETIVAWSTHEKTRNCPRTRSTLFASRVLQERSGQYQDHAIICIWVITLQYTFVKYSKVTSVSVQVCVRECMCVRVCVCACIQCYFRLVKGLVLRQLSA